MGRAGAEGSEGWQQKLGSVRCMRSHSPVMESYALIVLAAVLVPVIAYVAVQEQRRRIEAARFEALQQALAWRLGSLQASAALFG